jgi:hypothetical protein
VVLSVLEINLEGISVIMTGESLNVIADSSHIIFYCEENSHFLGEKNMVTAQFTQKYCDIHWQNNVYLSHKVLMAKTFELQA